MTDVTGLHHRIGKDLSALGGYLRCEECGREQALRNIPDKLAQGWPKCHGYTMRWITDKEIAADVTLAPKQSSTREET